VAQPLQSLDILLGPWSNLHVFARRAEKRDTSRLFFTGRISFPVLLGSKMPDNDCEIQIAIIRAQAGDAQAWDFIIAQMGYIVESVCSRMEIVDAADLSRSDLRQEIWLRVWFLANRRRSDWCL
jgi:hypothetical protein